MQVTTEAVSGVARRLNVSVPTSRVNEQFEARLKRTAKTVKINGFRPGKVPENVVRREYGASIYQEVVNDIIRDSVFEAIQQEKINAVGMPNIEKVEHKEDALVFEATVEVYPEIEVKAFDGLEVERKSAEIKDADVDAMIENLQKQRQTWAVTKGMAKKDMQVTFDFEGTIDGEKFEGGSAEDFKLVLGSGRMIPGFEEQLVGSTAGEEKVITVTFPADYQAENLAGKEAQFKINVKKVVKPTLPELDATFLEAFGVKDGSVDQFRADVRKNMERELRNGVRAKVKSAVFDALVKANSIQLPKALVAEEISRQRQQAIQQFGGKNAQIKPEMLPDELFKEQSERSVALGLLVSEIIRANEITVDAERVRALVDEVAQSYEQPEEVVKWYYSSKEQMAQVQSAVLEDQVVDLVLAKAQITDKAVGYEELLRPQA